MEGCISNTIRIKSHPISKLDKKFRMQYLMGLAEFMYYINLKFDFAYIVFHVWYKGIDNELPKSYWSGIPSFPRLHAAMKIKRKGLNFFRMRNVLLFDCLYLASLVDSTCFSYAETVLQTHLKGLFTRRVLKHIISNWNILRETEGIPGELIYHKRINANFKKSQLRRILVVATMSAGKSTLINAMTGSKINLVKSTACTDKLRCVYNKAGDDGITVRLSNGTYSYHYRAKTAYNTDFVDVGLPFRSNLSGRHLCFIDTPGTNYSKNPQHGIITRNAISQNNYDLVIIVVNGTQFNTDDEDSLIDYTLAHTQKPVVFVVNQLDRLNPEDDSIKDIIDDLKTKLIGKIKNPIIVPVSSYYALLQRQETDLLTTDDVVQKKMLSIKFKNTFYDFESYMHLNTRNFNNNAELRKTGIPILEEILNNITK